MGASQAKSVLYSHAAKGPISIPITHSQGKRSDQNTTSSSSGLHAFNVLKKALLISSLPFNIK